MTRSTLREVGPTCCGVLSSGWDPTEGTSNHPTLTPGAAGGGVGKAGTGQGLGGPCAVWASPTTFHSPQRFLPHLVLCAALLPWLLTPSGWLPFASLPSASLKEALGSAVAPQATPFPVPRSPSRQRRVSCCRLCCGGGQFCGSAVFQHWERHGQREAGVPARQEVSGCWVLFCWSLDAASVLDHGLSEGPHMVLGGCESQSG